MVELLLSPFNEVTCSALGNTDQRICSDNVGLVARKCLVRISARTPAPLIEGSHSPSQALISWLRRYHFFPNTSQFNVRQLSYV
jgi:hypothetical protein